MIDEILPESVVAVEAFEDTANVALFPEESAALTRAIEKRRREFMTGRDCARRALQKLGRTPQTIPPGPHGEPQWPMGIVGSITHCDGYRACALAKNCDIVTIGIDAEPYEPLPDGICAEVASSEEIVMLLALKRHAPTMHWDRILFSAKESMYKAWFPLARRWLGFEDAVLSIDPRGGSFTGHLLVPGPSLAGRELAMLPGRWLARAGFAMTAIALASGPPTNAYHTSRVHARIQ